MDCTVTQNDLKILLLKCVGSKYPVKIITDHQATAAYIKGFADPDCSILIITSEQGSSHRKELGIENIKRIETHNIISFERFRSNVFNVN